MALIYLVSVVVGYLLGSFPTGYLVGRRYGIDIREHGSRNMGATNVVRVLGKKPGYFVFFCDAIKGLLAVRLAILLARFVAWHHYLNVIGSSGFTGPDSIYDWSGRFFHANSIEAVAGIPAGLACILGHNFPVWLRFRGGKGVATTIGVILGLMPAAFAVAVGVWMISFFTLRYVSLASLLAAAALPVVVGWLTRANGPISGPAAPMFWFSVVAALLIFWRHRANIGRLLNGTESRFDRKPPTPAA